MFRINFLSRVTSIKYKVCLKPILVKIQAFSNAFQNYNFYLVKVVTKKKIFFFVTPFWKNRWWKTTPIYMCMIFHKKIFQRVTASIPLFQIPQKIGLLKHNAWTDLSLIRFCGLSAEPITKRDLIGKVFPFIISKLFFGRMRSMSIWATFGPVKIW